MNEFADRIAAKVKGKSAIKASAPEKKPQAAAQAPAQDKAPINGDGLFGEKLMTVEELADMLRISEYGIRRRVAAKQIPFIKIGLITRFRPSKIAEWLSKDGAGSLECIKVPCTPDRRTRKKKEKTKESTGTTEASSAPAKKPPPKKPQKNKSKRKGSKK